MPESLHGIAYKLLRAILQEYAHYRLRKHIKRYEHRCRHHHYGAQPVAQQLAALIVPAFAVIKAYQRLRALRHAHHKVYYDGVHIRYYGICHHAVVTYVSKHGPVEQKHHQARTKLRHAVCKAYGYEPLVYLNIKAEFPYAEGASAVKKMDYVYDARYKLG